MVCCHRLLVLCLILLGFLGSDCLAEDEANFSLPHIWQPDDQYSRESKPQYWIRAELRSPALRKVYLLDEWATRQSDKFRQDSRLLSENKRFSVLIDLKTRDEYHFEPFKCNNITGANQFLDSEFSDKFPNHLAAANGNEGPADITLPRYSIGSLWEFALSQQESRMPKIVDGKWTIRFSSHSYPFAVTFHLRGSFQDPNSVSGITIETDDGVNRETVMQIRIIQLTRSLDKILRESPDLFELPLGYGCQLNPSDQRLFGEPPNLIDFQAKGGQVFGFDVTSLRPANSSDQDLAKWKSSSTSVRLLAGSLSFGLEDQPRDYMMLETRDYVRQLISLGSKGKARAKLRRLRQIWDLGVGGLNHHQDVQMELDGVTELASYYEIDDRTSQCLGHGQVNRDAGLGLRFPSNNQILGQEECPFPLGTKQLNLLFGSSASWHLVRNRLSSRQAGARELTYEMRLPSFEPNTEAKGCPWSGPVSIVRSHLLQPGGEQQPRKSLDQPPELSVTMLFLSQDRDQIVAKVQVNLGERRQVEQSTLHHELDVSACYTQLGGGSRDLDFEMSFPNPGDSSIQLNNNNSIRDMEAHALGLMFARAEHRLDPLQLASLRLDKLASGIRLSGRLLARPSLVNFVRTNNRRISGLTKAVHLFRELQPSEWQCADSCHHYRCITFSYCSASSQCLLFLGSRQELAKAVIESTAEQDNCALFSLTDFLQSHWPIDPLEMMQKMKELQLETDNQPEVAPLLVEWRPANNEASDSDDETGVARAEYELLMVDRSFIASDLPIGNYLSLLECRELCDKTDCQSFGYCQMERTCQVSHLHDEPTIRQLSQSKASCLIMSRDWLSKFTGPIKVRLATIESNLTSGLDLKVDGARSCARECMEAEGKSKFKCLSFYYCPGIEGQNWEATNNCLLHNRHSLGGPEPVVALAKSELQPDAKIECLFYSRSYLSEFDRYFGRSLPEPEVAGHTQQKPGGRQMIMLQRKLGAEACGFECAKLEGDCLAFQVCRSSSSGSLCGLLMSYGRPLVSSGQLEPSDECTSFLLKANSELMPRAKASEPQEPATRQEPRANRNWISAFLFMLLGLGLGLLLANQLERLYLSP